MSEQDLQREAERYAEHQREDEAYEEANYDDQLAKAEQRIAELKAERDTAFAMSRCECGVEEACRNLVAKDQRIANLEARVQEFWTGMGRPQQQLVDTTAALQELLAVYDAAKSGSELMSNQGQAMDGYSELANYRAILDKYQKESSHD